jgi:hypothetical protein
MDGEERSFWETLGEALGQVIAWVADLAGAVWDRIGSAIGDFFAGLARGAGLEDAGIFAWVLLVLGILLVLSAIRGFMRRALVGPLFQLAFGLLLIGVVVA